MRCIKKTLFVTLLLVGLTVVVTSIFWNFDYLTGAFSPKYVIQVRWQEKRPLTNDVNNIIVVFQKENRTISSCVVSLKIINGSLVTPWQNVTLQIGQYDVKLYNADSGVYMTQFEIYVDRELARALPFFIHIN
jgi:hypothetical protein